MFIKVVLSLKNSYLCYQIENQHTLIVSLQIIWLLAFFLLVHSYVFYPLIIKWLAKGKSSNKIYFTPDDLELPTLVIIMAVYNEEAVIDEKLASIFSTNYPLQKIQIYIGSDNSTDQTNEIIEAYQAKYNNIYFKIFEGRNGKIKIVNQLIMNYEARQKNSEHSIYILTDANVFFAPTLLYQLAKHFKNPSIGLVAANILNKQVKCTGISLQEQWYIQRENGVKYYEGILWGTMMGAFGACYAVRKEQFKPTPANFIVDDFYISMQVLVQGKQAIKAPTAICYEDVSNDIWEEFRRKKRISAGNFQNLATFYPLLHIFRYPKVAFCFWSHKVIRWFGPILLLLVFVTALWLSQVNHFFQFVLFLQIGIFLIPFVDYILKKVNVHIKIFRFITYFLLMNIALFIGLLHYLKGIKTNVWKPTKRN